MKTRIVSDRRFDIGDVESLDPFDPGAMRQWIERALDARIGVAVLVGDDATVAAFATAQADVGCRRSEQLDLAIVAAGDVTTVADTIGAPSYSRRALSKLVSRVERGGMTRRALPTLRVVDSAEPGARIVLTFGIGLVGEWFENRSKIRKRDAARAVFRSTDHVDADVFIDWARHTGEFGTLIASSLGRTWAGIEMGDGPTVRIASGPIALVRGGTRVGRVVERVVGRGATRFDCVHIDTNSDYVVDGVVVRTHSPRLVALTPGPQLRVVT